MPTTRPILFLWLPIIAAALFMACGGGGDDDAEGSAEATSPTSEPTNDGATATETVSSSDSPTGTATTSGPTATATATAEATTASSDDEQSDFRGLTSTNAGSTHTVVYDVTGPEIDSARWTMAQDPPRAYRQIETDEGEVLLLDDGTRQYACIESDGAGTCLNLAASGFAGRFLDPDEVTDTADTAADFQEIEGRTIAGRESRCFTYTDEGNPAPSASIRTLAMSCTSNQRGSL